MDADVGEAAEDQAQGQGAGPPDPRRRFLHSADIRSARGAGQASGRGMIARVTDRQTPGVVVALGLGVIVVFLLAMLTATHGHFVPQVVDLYLICQYAKAMALGHPFQYNAGEAAST